MTSFATCAGAWPVEIPLASGCRLRFWRGAGVAVALAAILLAGLSWPGLLAALTLLWVVARLPMAPLVAVTIDRDELSLLRRDGRRIRLDRPWRCHLQPGVITLELPGLRRARIFSDQCSDEAFRTLRRLLSAGGGDA